MKRLTAKKEQVDQKANQEIDEQNQQREQEKAKPDQEKQKGLRKGNYDRGFLNWRPEKPR
ncbi:MAG: hypothetical protein ACLFQV_10150 [Vulcanimicrobiota bacterium]